MQIHNTKESYGSLSKFFHWTIVLLMITQFALIYYRDTLPENSPTSTETILLHKSFGILVFTMGFLFMIWHHITPRLNYPSTMQKAQRILARCMHIVLFLCLLLMPLSGYLMSTAHGYASSFFGLFKLPMVIEKSKPLSELFGDAHHYIGLAILVIVSLHFLAAMAHHFYYKDNILKRMLPCSKCSG